MNGECQDEGDNLLEKRLHPKRNPMAEEDVPISPRCAVSVRVISI